MTMVHDLIDEQVLSWRDARRTRQKATLPGILARLASGELADFPRVRAHQFHPWSMFLTQLAAIALRRAGRSDPGVGEREWREMLLALTDGAHEPWCLVVDDLVKPAFFQPPVPEARKDPDVVARWETYDHPDDADILVTAKAHDVKMARLDANDSELWAYALMTLQTTQGYPSPRHRGISRMNGGRGNRPRVGLAPDLSLGSRFRRDVRILLDTWDTAIQRHGYRDEGVALVWTVPWDGSDPLEPADLAPHFIEICCRVRCVIDCNAIRCAYTPTRQRRTLPRIENGDVGDPWIPIERDKGALTIRAGGFCYKRLSSVLFGGDFEPAAAQMPRTDDSQTMLLVASAMARGKSRTDGLHERVLPINAEIRRRLLDPEARQNLGSRAEEQVKKADLIRKEVLGPALGRLKLGKVLPGHRLDARIDQVFFADLFENLTCDDERARLAWEKRLVELARRELEDAISRCCLPDARRYRAIAEARRVFENGLREHFPDALEADHGAVASPEEGAEA